MGEKTPDSGESGIERRDMLKGLGFGALGLAGAGAATSVTARENQQSEQGSLLIDYIRVVPEAEEPEVNQNTYVDRPWATADLVFGLDFETENQKEVLDGPVPIGYQFTVINQRTRQPVTESFEEGRCMCFAGNVDVSPGGSTEVRETFSLSGLGPDQPNQPPNSYYAVVTVTDYRQGLDPKIKADTFQVTDRPPQEGGGEANQTGADTQTTEAGNGGAENGGDDTTPTTTTTTGNQTAGNGNGGNDGNQSSWPI